MRLEKRRGHPKNYRKLEAVPEEEYVCKYFGCFKLALAVWHPAITATDPGFGQGGPSSDPPEKMCNLGLRI